jgi:hypothetical protein
LAGFVFFSFGARFADSGSIMHARELVELATVVSAHGQVLIQSGRPLSPDGLEQYWTASKVRLDRWSWWLRHFSERASDEVRRRGVEWPEVYGVMEEVLTGEMLTRAWAAVLCACDRRQNSDAHASTGRSVLIGHMESRHRVSMLMLKFSGEESEAGIRLNRLRRRVECWTDVLIGHLACTADVAEFAFDCNRAKDFAGDFAYRRKLPSGRQMWPLLAASLRSAFRQDIFFGESPNGDVNARIAAGVISCFPVDIFDSTGLISSPWLLRLSNAADDAQCMIDELLGVEKTSAATECCADFSRRGRGRLR